MTAATLYMGNSKQAVRLRRFLMAAAAYGVCIPLLAFANWLGFIPLLVLVLPCFAVVGGRISELRQRLRRTNQELSEALQMIQKMATHDTLTALPNRALFNETLSHAIGQAKRHDRSLALLFMDLDR